MGEIIKSEVTKEGKVMLKVSMQYSEFLDLKGHLKNIHMFSEDLIDVHSHLSLRGKHGATKYLLIPKCLRKNIKTDVICQKQETEKEIFFIYVIKKKFLYSISE